MDTHVAVAKLGDELGQVVRERNGTLVAAASAMTMIGPRVYSAMARDGYLPKLFAAKDDRRCGRCCSRARSPSRSR